MSVIAELRVAADDFELGRILTANKDTTVEFEGFVPGDETAAPLWWRRDATPEAFVETLRTHPSVRDASAIDVVDGRTLFTLDCEPEDSLFSAISAHEGDVRSASGTPETWTFELEFPSQAQLTAFTTDCVNNGIDVSTGHVYTPTETESEPAIGLTEPQREAITLAVNWGYYDIPRGCTTKELAAELGISDQAVTERLRRAIDTLVSDTIIATADGDS